MDGKEHGLKIFEKRPNVFKVLMLNLEKWTKNIMFSAPCWNLFHNSTVSIFVCLVKVLIK